MLMLISLIYYLITSVHADGDTKITFNRTCEDW